MHTKIRTFVRIFCAIPLDYRIKSQQNKQIHKNRKRDFKITFWRCKSGQNLYFLVSLNIEELHGGFKPFRLKRLRVDFGGPSWALFRSVRFGAYACFVYRSLVVLVIALS